MKLQKHNEQACKACDPGAVNRFMWKIT